MSPVAGSAAAPRGRAGEGARAASRMAPPVGLLTGGGDRPYACGMAAALAGAGLRVEVIGSDEVQCPELGGIGHVRVLNLRGSVRPDASGLAKAWRVARYYGRLLRWAARTDARLLHILWNNKVEWFDRTLMMAYYRCWGKAVAMTVHNVNAGVRDDRDSLLNRLTLRAQYHLADHLFVHTERMKRELAQWFGVGGERVTVVPFGVDETVPDTALDGGEARRRLGLPPDARVVLFFGTIAPYKGLEVLVEAFRAVAARAPGYRLVIAGAADRYSAAYAADVRRRTESADLRGLVVPRFAYVPDAETEVYMKAADVLVLPYRDVAQSGVLFLGYRFGLPVVATDVGALREEVVEGETGFVCRPGDAADLAAALERYFASALYRALPARRAAIAARARERNSWARTGALTKAVYDRLLGGRP